MKYRWFLILGCVIVLVVFNLKAVFAEQSSSTVAQSQQYVAPDRKGKGPEKEALPNPSGIPSANVVAVQPPTGYRVGMDDELAISVWHEPELSQVVVVRSDGMITLPLLNDIKVAGLTTDQMQAILTDKMKSLVNDPQVTIIVRAIRSRKVWLVGNVARPGVYGLGGQETILEVLTEAGGLGPFAKTRSIYILRHQNGKPVRIGFNYKKALTGKGENPILEPGDMVVVP